MEREAETCKGICQGSVRFFVCRYYDTRISCRRCAVAVKNVFIKNLLAKHTIGTQQLSNDILTLVCDTNPIQAETQSRPQSKIINVSREVNPVEAKHPSSIYTPGKSRPKNFQAMPNNSKIKKPDLYTQRRVRFSKISFYNQDPIKRLIHQPSVSSVPYLLFEFCLVVKTLSSDLNFLLSGYLAAGLGLCP